MVIQQGVGHAVECVPCLERERAGVIDRPRRPGDVVPRHVVAGRHKGRHVVIPATVVFLNVQRFQPVTKRRDGRSLVMAVHLGVPGVPAEPTRGWFILSTISHSSSGVPPYARGHLRSPFFLNVGVDPIFKRDAHIVTLAFGQPLLEERDICFEQRLAVGSVAGPGKNVRMKDHPRHTQAAGCPNGRGTKSAGPLVIRSRPEHVEHGAMAPHPFQPVVFGRRERGFDHAYRSRSFASLTLTGCADAPGPGRCARLSATSAPTT